MADVITQDGNMPEAAVRRFGASLAAGLLYLHSSGIIYGDLCPLKVQYKKKLFKQNYQAVTGFLLILRILTFKILIYINN